MTPVEWKIRFINLKAAVRDRRKQINRLDYFFRSRDFNRALRYRTSNASRSRLSFRGYETFVIRAEISVIPVHEGIVSRTKKEGGNFPKIFRFNFRPTNERDIPRRGINTCQSSFYGNLTHVR